MMVITIEVLAWKLLHLLLEDQDQQGNVLRSPKDRLTPRDARNSTDSPEMI